MPGSIYMITMSVDQERCIQCYSCIAECPFDLVNLNKEGFPQLRKAAVKKCIQCGHCMAICPTEALDISISPLADSRKVSRKLIPDPEIIENFLLSRRSTRTYKKKVVEHGILEDILNISRYAPSAHNCQPVHWLMVETPEETRRLAGMVVEKMTELKIFPGLIRAWNNGDDKVLRGAPHLAIAHADPADSEHPVEDCTLATSYLELAAHSYGIGACWAGFLMQIAHDHPPLTAALNLPAGHKVYTALMLGYPKTSYQRIPQRRALSVRWK